MTFKNCLLSISCLLCFIAPKANGQKTENLILITLDGLRWEELFTGADSMLITNSAYVHDTSKLKTLFWKSTPADRRKTLMPFFWSTLVQEGQIYGNRLLNSKVNCSNAHWFSYPGYGEILGGLANETIHSNDKIPNPDTTFLEFLNRSTDFQGKVAAFGSWDVFPFIINTERSGIPVNAGFQKPNHTPLTPKEAFLNTLQDEIPSPWGSVRLDAFTHHYAMEYLKVHTPRILYIAYGETDDFAHDGRYDHYLNSAHQTDQWIADLWHFVQNDAFYKNKTTLIITTDHGRGSYKDGGWKSHGTSHIGSDAVWIAAIGPDTPHKGEVKDSAQLWQRQIAATCMKLLRQKPLPANRGAAISSIYQK